MKPMMKLRLLCREGMQSCQKGHLDNAHFQLHMALRITKGLKHRLLEAKVRNNLALVLQLMGDHAQALRQLRLALVQTERQAGKDNAMYRNISKNLKAAELELTQKSGTQDSSSEANRESERSFSALSALHSSQPKRSAGAASNLAT